MFKFTLNHEKKIHKLCVYSNLPLNSAPWRGRRFANEGKKLLVKIAWHQ